MADKEENSSDEARSIGSWKSRYLSSRSNVNQFLMLWDIVGAKSHNFSATWSESRNEILGIHPVWPEIYRGASIEDRDCRTETSQPSESELPWCPRKWVRPYSGEFLNLSCLKSEYHRKPISYSRPSIIPGRRSTKVVLATVTMIAHIFSVMVASVSTSILIDERLLAANLGMAHWKKLVSNFRKCDWNSLFLQFWHWTRESKKMVSSDNFQMNYRLCLQSRGLGHSLDKWPVRS